MAQGDAPRHTGRDRATTLRLARRVAAAAGLVFVAILGYFTADLFRARAETPRIVARALAAPGLELTADDLSQQQLRALLAVQDPGFFSHKGWDFANGTMTTITQSLAKGLYFERFRPGIRKVRQSLIARFALDPQLSKQDQLRLFINTIWLARVEGRDVVGFAQGARVFYGKEFSQLTYEEYLSLLMFDNPVELNVRANPDRNHRRVKQIERLLAGECRRPGLLGLAPNCWTEDP